MKLLLALSLLWIAGPTSAQSQPLRQPSEAEIQRCCFLLRIGRQDYERHRESPAVLALLNQLIRQQQQLMSLLIQRQSPLSLTPPQQRLPLTPPQQRLPLTPPQQRLPLQPPQQRLPQSLPQQRLPLTPPTGYQTFTHANYPGRSR